MNLDEVTAADFEKLVGESFTVIEIEDCELHLDRVEILNRHEKSTRDPFALVFSGKQSEPLSQQIFELRHDEAGSLSIFLVPVGETDEGYLYEAVFN